MKAEYFSTLKEKVLTAENFDEVWQYFFDHFSDNPRFIDMGQKTENSFLQSILEGVGERLFRKKGEVTNMLFVKIPQHRFIHGACCIQGRMASVMYFEDVKLGILSVIGSLLTHEVMMVRFTGLEVQGKGPFMVDYPRDRLVH